MRLRNVPGAKEWISHSEYVIQNPSEYRGKWQEVFHNSNPIRIEVGMGKGQFLLKLADRNPQINYIGIEKYDSVLVRALEKLEQEERDNIRLLRIDAKELDSFFAMDEIDVIYLNFSDPWPKDRHAKRRLTSRQFLERYDKILKQEGRIEFKTDNRNLFDFSLEEAAASDWKLDAVTYNLHAESKMLEGNVMTEYEEKFSAMGNPIHKMMISRIK